MFIILTMSPDCTAMLYHDQVFLYWFTYQYCCYRSRPHAPCGVAKAISGVGGMVVLRQSSCSHCHLGRKTRLCCQLREGTVTHSLARLLRPTGTMFYWLFTLSTQCNVDSFKFLRYYEWFFFKEPSVWLWFKIHKADILLYTSESVSFLDCYMKLPFELSCSIKKFHLILLISIDAMGCHVCTANSRSSTVAESVRHTKDLKLASVFTSQIIVAYSNTKKC